MRLMRYILTVGFDHPNRYSNHESLEAAVEAAKAIWGDHIRVVLHEGEVAWSVYDRDLSDEEARSLGNIAPGFVEEVPEPPVARDDPQMVALGLGTVRVSEEVSRAFRDAADERGISMSEAIREALGEWVIRQAQRPR